MSDAVERLKASTARLRERIETFREATRDITCEECHARLSPGWWALHDGGIFCLVCLHGKIYGTWEPTESAALDASVDPWEALTTEQRGEYLKRAADPSITADAVFEIAKRMARDDAAKKGHP